MTQRIRRALALAAVVLVMTACGANKPPNLTPQANAAFYGTQAIKDLDLVRDVAVDANAQVPPLMNDAATRKVVNWHQSAITIVHATPNGWKATVAVSLDELVRNLSPSERQIVAPYVALLKTVLAEVIQ